MYVHFIVNIFSHQFFPGMAFNRKLVADKKCLIMPFLLFLTFFLARFGLFEAMSAIEMMDPKMDAGMLCNKAKKVLQFEPAVKVSKVGLGNFSFILEISEWHL